MDIDQLGERIGLDGDLLDVRLFEISGTPVTLATLVTFALIVLATLAISWVLQRAMVRGLALRRIRDEGSVGVARRLAHYAVMAIGLGIGFQTVGLDLSALFAAGAVFAIGLGFAMQNIAQNFVSGLILLLERSIKPGDVLEIEGRFVRVARMGIRATIAKTLDDEEIIIPNSIIVHSSVKNYTLRDSYYRLRTTVGVTYASDLRAVRAALEGAAREATWRATEKDPVILLTEFGSSSVNYDVSVWIENPWRMARHRSELNEAIWWALREAGVTIAFPQVDVHFDRPVMDSLAGLGRAG